MFSEGVLDLNHFHVKKPTKTDLHFSLPLPLFFFIFFFFLIVVVEEFTHLATYSLSEK